MTRGRDANHAYIPLDHHHDDAGMDEAHHDDTTGRAPTTGREVLEQILATSRAETSATEQLAPAPVSRQPVSARRPQEREWSLASARRRGRDGPGSPANRGSPRSAAHHPSI